MKLLVPVFFCFLLVVADTHAQKNQQPAYIVLTSHDTLSGFINYREWHRNPTFILFSSSKENQSKRYATKELLYFEVTGKEKYETHTVTISMDPQMLSELAGKNMSTKRDTVFLKVVYQGKNITLFSYKDELKLRWFVKQTSETAPEELLNSTYKINGSVMNERQYRLQLTQIAARNYPENHDLKNLINDARYGESDLLNICYRIDGLRENEISKERTNSDQAFSRFIFFAGIGVNRGSLSFAGNSRFTGVHNPASYLPLINGGVDVYVIPAVGRLFLRNNLIATEFRSAATSPTKNYFQATETYYFKFTQLNFSLNSQLSYNIYNRPNFKWVLGGGIGFNFSAYRTNEQTFIREGLNATTIIDDNFVDPIQKFWINVSVRSGVVIGNIELSLWIFPNATISEHVDWSLSNSSLQIHLNYQFQKKRFYKE